MKRSPLFPPKARALLLGAAALLWLLALPTALKAATATQFNITTSYGAGDYNVGDSVTFHVEASDGVTSPVTTYTGSVTISFADTFDQFQNSDPLVQIDYTPMGPTPSIGSAVLTFTAGVLDFTAVFGSGSNAELLYLRDNGGPPITKSFPGSFGGGTGTSYRVRGYSETYYLKDADASATPAVYPTDTDELTQAVTTLQAPDASVLVRASTGVVGSSIYVISGINGGFAKNDAPLLPNLEFLKATTDNQGKVTFWVILDYNGNFTDYDNPVTTVGCEDTFYMGTLPDLSTSYQPITFASRIAGPILGNTDRMENGKIIVRIWSEGGEPVSMRWKSPLAGDLSFIEIPYSPLNNSPVRLDIQPKQFLSSNSAPISFILTNSTAFDMAQAVFKIPVNSPLSGANWSITSMPSTVAGYSSSSISYSNPTTVDGAVTVNFGGFFPLPSSEGVTIPATITASDQSGVFWNFDLTSAEDLSATQLTMESSGAQVETLAAPSMPASFTAVPANYLAAGQQVALSWGQVTDQSADGYAVSLRTPAGGPGTFMGVTLINSNAITAVTLTGLVNGSSYDFTVSAKNSVSSSVTAMAGPVTPFANPGAPGPVTALTGGTSIQLNWGAAVTGTFPLGGYNIYRDTVPNPAAFLVSVGAGATSYDDTGASLNQTYYYRIAAVDNQSVTGSPGSGAHISSYSTQVQGFPPGNAPLSVAAVFQPTATPTAIQVTWQAPVSNIGSPANYVIIRQVDSNTPTTFVHPASPYDDTSVVPGSVYSYRVAGLYAGPVTTNYSVTVTGRVGPSAPLGLMAAPRAPSGNAITWTWNANPGPENVNNYLLVQTSPAAVTTATGGPASLLVSGLTQGVDYAYAVLAVDSFGVTSPLSSSVTSALLANAPLTFSATADAAVRSNVNLAWATPVSSANGTGYNLYRNTINTFPVATPIAALGAAPLTYQDASLSSANAGTTFFYFLKAVNAGGEGVSAVAGLQLPPNPPGTPTPSSSSSSVTLAWTANPGSEAVSYYTVWRNPGAGFVSVGRVNSPGTSFTDSAVTAGGSYAYRLTATNPGSGATILGGESLPSASVTYGPRPPAPLGLAITLTQANSVTLTWNPVTVLDASVTAVQIQVGATPTATLAAGVTTFNGTFAADTTYTFGVVGLNPYGAGATATISRLTYPGAISSLTVNFLSDQVTRVASWNLAGGSVTLYNIYRGQSPGGPFSLVQAVPNPGSSGPVTVTLTQSVQPGQTYYYVVRANNATGEGPDSNVATFNVPPSAPASLTASSGVTTDARVALSWQAVSGQGVVDYRIYRDNVPSSGYVSIGNTGSQSVTAFSDTTPPTGPTTYAYKVLSYNGQQTAVTLAGPVTVVSFALPGTPGGLAAAEASGAVTLSWSQAGVQTSYALQSFVVYQSAVSGTTGSAAATVSGASSTVLVSGLANGTTYYFSLRAIDVNGNQGALSSQVSALPVAPPQAPLGVAGTGADQSAQITWNAAVQGTLPVGSYILYRAVLPATLPVSLTSRPASFTGYVDTGLTNGVSYIYWVQAVDSTGTAIAPHASGLSASVTVSPSNNAFPNPPDNVTGSFASTSATIGWTEATLVAGASVTAYQLNQATVATGPYSPVSVVTAVGGSYSLPVTGLANGTRYYYYLSSMASNGNLSANSTTVTGIPSAPPAAPTGLTAVDGNGQVTLTWSAVPPTGSVTILNYVVYQDAVSIATTAGPVTSYTASSLSNGTTYVFNVSAVNSNSQEGVTTAPVNGYPYVLGAPVSFASASSATAVTLTFGAPVAPSYPVVSYQVFRGVTPGGYSLASPLATPSGSPYPDASVTLGQMYYYAVRAVDSQGHVGTLSGEILDGAVAKPSAPVPVFQAGNNQNLVEWAPVTTGPVGSLPVSYYVVTRSSGAAVTLTASQTYFLDTAAANGVSVGYSVYSVDATGQFSDLGHWSLANSGAATALASTLNPPVALAASTLSSSSLLVTWSPPDDQGKDIDYYLLTRSVSFAGPYGNAVTIDADQYPPQTAVTVSGLSGNRTYYFLMRAVERGTLANSGPSNHAWATTAAGSGAAQPGDMVFDRNLFLPPGETLTITYDPPATGSLALSVYNVAGQEIYEFPAIAATSGVQGTAVWDGRDRNGNLCASGLYLVEIRMGSFHLVKKVAVVK